MKSLVVVGAWLFARGMRDPINALKSVWGWPTQRLQCGSSTPI